ncbi:MAG: response regulator [Chthoniobacter sp.]|nr:response regulator [Chthoniobacter sp.]
MSARTSKPPSFAQGRSSPNRQHRSAGPCIPCPSANSRRCQHVLLLDILMPKIDGVTVLRQIKADPELCKLPVIVLTTTDDLHLVLDW